MSPSLNVTIIGAGIAGTLAARVLREKHNVTLLEKIGEGHELGAAINLGPNATRILDQYGFDRKRAGSISVGGTRTLTHEGKVIIESVLPDLKAQFGGDWIVQHRADLWNEFFTLATAPSEELGLAGQPAKIIWGAEVVDVDVESGDVKLADGRVIHSDLVIGMSCRRLRSSTPTKSQLTVDQERTVSNPS
jgi:salicylate hydroxylase